MTQGLYSIGGHYVATIIVTKCLVFNYFEITVVFNYCNLVLQFN